MATLAEDLYLLANNGSTGRFRIDTSHLDLGLGGAMLLDLALRGHVESAGSRVVVTAGPPTGEPLLDTALDTITPADRRHAPDHWVHHLARGAHRAVQDHLVEAGVLRREDTKVLHVLPVHRTRETNGRLHSELLDHLTDSVALERPPSRETAALASLALAIG